MSAESMILRTFELAKNAGGKTWPNPLVGSVIVKNNKIIGEGYHTHCGADHAEIHALKNCTESPEGATLYVNLEPCCHVNKRTPPCAQRLIQEKIKKVIICNLDPNPAVNGKGVELLRKAGVEVEYGILASVGEKLNEVFFTAQRFGRPFVHLKMASTLDGKIALPSGESQWITGEVARTHVHELRSLHQAVMVGAETVRKDNPKLNVRLKDYQDLQPYRVIISRSGQIPASSNLLTDELKERTFIYSSIEEALSSLYEKKIINILLEGGPQLAASFMQKKLVDRISLYLNPSLLGEGHSVLQGFSVTNLSERPRLKDVEWSKLGEDFLITGKLN